MNVQRDNVMNEVTNKLQQVMTFSLC